MKHQPWRERLSYDGKRTAIQQESQIDGRVVLDRSDNIEGCETPDRIERLIIAEKDGKQESFAKVGYKRKLKSTRRIGTDERRVPGVSLASTIQEVIQVGLETARRERKVWGRIQRHEIRLGKGRG